VDEHFSEFPNTKTMAFISQSGAICTAILDLSIKENIGFSYFVSLGDMLALGKKFGFNIKKVLGVGEYELSIDFQKN
jgi:recombinational DNA repair protein RecT